MPAKNPVSILHFADAHIDIANYGRHDPESALPVRVVDFLSALDEIVDAAIAEPVDLVLFAGDAYKDRNPQPTFQREWGRRMMRLSEAGIPTLLLVGNHDVAPASGRAHTLQEYSTLHVPGIFVADSIRRWGPEDLGVPLQVISVPWVSRGHLMASQETAGKRLDEILTDIENRVTKGVGELIETADPDLPLVLAAHASVLGAAYGSEREVMLGHELVLSGSLIADNRLDYVALGHIHKHQLVSAPGQHPPAVYPGSIERIDFGEESERKGFVLAQVAKGHTEWAFKPLSSRRFHTFRVEARQAATFMDDVMDSLPAPNLIQEAICRVRLTYPRDLEPLLDEERVRERFAGAFSIQIQKDYLLTRRARLGDLVDVEQMSPEDLLAQYWQTLDLDEAEEAALQALAVEILASVPGET